MGRWRDMVVLSRNPSDAIKVERLEELVVDQCSNIVGKDSRGVYLAEVYELNAPVFVGVTLHSEHLDGLEYSEKPKCWIDTESNKAQWDLLERSKEINHIFRERIAHRFSRFPYGLDFNGFISGEVSFINESVFNKVTGLVHMGVAVTPIHVAQKRYSYEPVGAQFSKWS